MPDNDSVVIPESLLIQIAEGQIVEMPLDEYLKGVVPTEMGLQKPIEALKAQAIAARAYAAVTRRHARDGFDLCSTVHCQAWRPKNRYADSDRAVDETTGLVATFQGRLVSTPFFGHCDGRTRNSEEVWGGKMAHCRSVPCRCGYSRLYGHGIGMCQRGAAAMARNGATAEQILKHYYTGIEITHARTIPRADSRRSLILGQVVDGYGQPRAGLRLVLEGSVGRFERGTTAEGRFWFSWLTSGRWQLAVKGRPVRYTDLVTDGRNTVELLVVVPDVPPRLASVIPLADPRLFAGTLGYEGVPVTLCDSAGNLVTMVSGSAPDFDPGGFAIALPPPGTCTLSFLDQSYDLEIGELGLWIRFSTEAE